MGTNAYYLNQFISTTLATVGGIDDSQTTGIILTSVTGVETTKPGIVCLSYSDPIDTSKAEWISYTSIDVTNELQGVTRGAEGFSAKSHSNGVTIAFPISESHINNLNDALIIGGSATNLATGVIDDDTFATASATKLATSESIKAYANLMGNGVNRQAIINGGFTVNQRVYVSNATLSAGSYGHDRWKAGASGGDYTFTQLPSSTQITIKTGKSLIQVIEDKNVVGGTYTLSWEGTAQARFGINSATPSGSYAVSPITITGQTAGTVMSVEFNEGTLGKVQLNTGSVALPFMPKSFEEELRACQRYYEKSYTYAAYAGSATENGMVENTGAGGACTIGDFMIVRHRYMVEKRINVTPTIYDSAGNSGKASFRKADSLLTDNISATADQGLTCSFRVYANATATTQRGLTFHYTADAEL